MTLLTKQVEVKWNGSNRKHYEALGYKWTKQGDSFTVKVEDLPSGSHVKVEVRCDYCGEIYRPRQGHFLRGRNRIEKDACGDRVCGAMKQAEIKILNGATTVANIPELLEEWHESNEESPSRVLANSHKKFRWKCSECSREWEARPKSRTSGKTGCPHCAGMTEARFNRYSEPLSVTHPELVKEWSGKNELRPDEITAGSGKSIVWKCKTCSNSWTSPIYRRTHGHGCPSCNESRGEKLAAKILDELNVCYAREYSFDKLRGSGGGSLRYDFAILKEGEPIALIEYDGEQHFRAVEHFGGEATLKRQQLHDRLKDDYARKRNIPLLRIRYDQSEEEVKEIVSEFVQIQEDFEKAV